MGERKVRVVCPYHSIMKSAREAMCIVCGADIIGTGTILTTLADPEAEALVADGERWRGMLDEAAADPDLGILLVRAAEYRVARRLANAPSSGRGEEQA